MSDRSFVRDASIASSLFLGLLAIFLLSPVRQITDSRYSMLLAEQLLTEGRFELDDYFAHELASHAEPGVRDSDRLPRQVQHGGVRLGPDESAPLYYIFPHASSILSVPLVALSRLAGHSTIDAHGRYDAAGEERIQAFWGAFLMAVAGATFFLTARFLLPPIPSLFVAGVTSVGSQVYSTASRGLWMQTWALLLLTAAAYLLVRSECGRGRPRLILLATLLSWCFFVRPIAALMIPPVALLVLLSHRQRFWIFALTGLTWLLLFTAYSEWLFGTPIPDYFTRGGNMALRHWGSGLRAGLISPSRGLFVYVPWVAMIGYGLIVYRRQLKHKRLACVMGLAFITHVLVQGSFRGWHAGACYGARYTTEIVPLIVVLGILALEAALDWRSDPASARGLRKTLEPTLLVVLVTIGVLFNGAGAISSTSTLWNIEPALIGHSRERVFDWSRPQWAVALFPQRYARPKAAILAPGR